MMIKNAGVPRSWKYCLKIGRTDCLQRLVCRGFSGWVVTKKQYPCQVSPHIEPYRFHYHHTISYSYHPSEFCLTFKIQPQAPPVPSFARWVPGCRESPSQRRFRTAGPSLFAKTSGKSSKIVSHWNHFQIFFSFLWKMKSRAFEKLKVLLRKRRRLARKSQKSKIMSECRNSAQIMSHNSPENRRRDFRLIPIGVKKMKNFRKKVEKISV